MSRATKKTVSFLLTVVTIISSCCAVTVFADNEKKEVAEDVSISFSQDEKTYDEYLSEVPDFNYGNNDIRVEHQNAIAETTTAEIASTGEITFTEIGQKAAFRFISGEEGLYNIKITYKPLEGTDLNPEIAVKLDGQYLFAGLENTKLLRWFKDKTDEWSKDGQGNEFAPEQTEVMDWYTQVLFDEEGIETDPYLIALSKGEHTVVIESMQEPVSISEIVFAVPENVSDYESAKKGYLDAKEYTGEDIVIQGEDAFLKSSSSLTAKSDNISASVAPQSPYKNLINYIGSSNWSDADQILTWEFEVKETALYALNIHYKQSEVTNGQVFRWIKIDGKTPFEEMKDVAFVYDTSWRWMTLGVEGESCRIFLEEGTHTLSMAVTLSEITEYYKKLKEIVDVLGDQYLKIAMITGESPDYSRDYELFRQIPELETVFMDCVDKMAEISAEMKTMSANSSTQYVSTIKAMTRVLNQMMERKFLAHTYKSDYYSQYCSLSALLYEMKNMPLSIDEIRFTTPEGSEVVKKNGSLWESIKYLVLSFFSSFTTDYNNVSSEGEKAELKLWVNWGRDQTQVLNSLIQESFTAETGISVNVQTTNASLIQGILTDNAPDISLNVSRSEPVNYAIRGASYDLSQFDDFEEVLKRFNEGATIPYEYDGGTYALPDTQNFYTMYYRKDILERIGVEIPETWDEFVEAMTIIQRNNMNVYLPYTKLTDVWMVNSGIGGLNLYSTLLAQNNCNVYNDELNANILDSSEAVEVFNWWTDMYTKYGVPDEQDFYNRFRIGVTPLGIAPYTQYTTFSQTAPEIEGKWGIALLPGVQQEDGSINRSSSGSGSGCLILNKSEHKEEAWEFLKWWTSADTQLRYSKNVESLLGSVGRVATSNKEAFSNYSWKTVDRDIMLKQWSQVVEIPEVPGSYYLSRAVDQAFWETINDSSTATDALLRWSNTANDEIARKIKEYSK